MSTVQTEKPLGVTEIEAQPSNNQGPVYDNDEKVNYNRTGAIDAEQQEHDMTVLQAVRAYPAASFWAFVMSCTIVRCSFHSSSPILQHHDTLSTKKKMCIMF